MLRFTVFLALALGAAADGDGESSAEPSSEPSKPPPSAPKPSAAPLFELGRGVTFYKNLNERWNMGERVSDGVALTGDFTSGSEGDVALKWKGIEKWKGSDIALDASLAVPVKVDASLVKPVSYKLSKMAASASAKRGAPLSALCREDRGYESNAVKCEASSSQSTRPCQPPSPLPHSPLPQGAIKLSIATDAGRPHVPKSLALEWVTTRTMLPKELTGGAKFTLTPTLRPRELASKGLAVAADCKAKIELLPHYKNYKGLEGRLSAPKARAACARAPRVATRGRYRGQAAADASAAGRREFSRGGIKHDGWSIKGHGCGCARN